MKFLTLICLLITMNLGATTPKINTVVTSAQIDLSHLFYSYDAVNFMDYGFPQQLAHSYSIKTTYQIPDALRAKSNSRDHGPYRSCQYNVCRDFPGFRIETVIMTHPDFKVTWELVDDTTKKIVSIQTGILSVEFAKSGNLGQTIQLADQNINGSFTISGQDSVQGIPLKILNPYSADKMKISYSIDFVRQRLGELKFDLNLVSSGDHQVSAVHFTDGFTKTIYKTQGAMLDFNRERIGFYFGMGATNSNGPMIVESMISHK